MILLDKGQGKEILRRANGKLEQPNHTPGEPREPHRDQCHSELQIVVLPVRPKKAVTLVYIPSGMRRWWRVSEWL